MSNLHSLSLYWPELILTFTILVIIGIDLLSRERAGHQVGYWLLAGLVLTTLGIFSVEPQLSTSLFLGTVALDGFARFFKLLIILATMVTVLVSMTSGELGGVRTGEYYLLIAIMAFGMFLMVSALDLIVVYLALEIVSISSFILAGYLRGNLRSTEASLKYVIYGAFSSGIMLFGLSILFGLTGTTRIFAIREALLVLNGGADLALLVGALLILAGFGYKVSAVPFHFWTPDVYEGAPTPVTAYLSVAPKAAGMALIIRFFNSVLGAEEALSIENWVVFTNVPWPQLLAALAVLTMTVGNLVALQQNSVKRMLAYSSIAHAGYMLLGLPVLSIQGVQAIMIYAVMYLFMNLGAFYVVIAVQNRIGGEDLEHFQGLGWRMPVIGLVMTVFMFALTGIPPTAGFIGKFYLFAAVIKAGPQFYWLAIVGVLNSVVSLYYYLRVVKVMYFSGEPDEKLELPPWATTAILLFLVVPTVLFGIWWTPVADWVRNSLLFFIPAL